MAGVCLCIPNCHGPTTPFKLKWPRLKRTKIQNNPEEASRWGWGFFWWSLFFLTSKNFLFVPQTFQKLSHQTNKQTKFREMRWHGTGFAKMLMLNLDSWLSSDIQKCGNKWIRTSAQGPLRVRTATVGTSHILCESTRLTPTQ